MKRPCCVLGLSLLCSAIAFWMPVSGIGAGLALRASRSSTLRHGIVLAVASPRTTYPRDALAPVTVSVQNRSGHTVQLTDDSCSIQNPQVENLNHSGHTVYPPALHLSFGPPCRLPRIHSLGVAQTLVKREYVIVRAAWLRARASLQIQGRSFEDCRPKAAARFDRESNSGEGGSSDGGYGADCVSKSGTVFRRERTLESVVDAGSAWSHTGWLRSRIGMAPARRFSALLCCEAGLREVVGWISHGDRRGLDSGRDAGWRTLVGEHIARRRSVSHAPSSSSHPCLAVAVTLCPMPYRSSRHPRDPAQSGVGA